MEIIVNGVGVKEYVPDMIRVNIKFECVNLDYNDVLENINKSVYDFINNCLLKNNFVGKDLKTKNFFIRENRKYDENNRKYINDGFICEQETELEFDYSNQKLSDLLTSISKLDNSPFYSIEFFIKNESVYRKEVIKLAYNDAYIKAKAIADASNKNLIDCVRIDFRPMDNICLSETSIGFTNKDVSLLSSVGDNFTPKNIKIVENLYCLWNAEEQKLK